MQFANDLRESPLCVTGYILGWPQPHVSVALKLKLSERRYREPWCGTVAN
jgi:hypothetical protein